MLWLLVQVGLTPRLALERSNANEVRTHKICELIEASRFSIHDISRVRLSKKDEYARLNMPFELGIDFACRRYAPKKRHKRKVILILEEEPYATQKALSDLSFSDPKPHQCEVEVLLEVLRDWLRTNGFKIKLGAAEIYNRYLDFQLRLLKELEARGFSKQNIQQLNHQEYLDCILDMETMDIGQA